MNRIAVLTEQETRGIHIEEQISRFCKGKGLFPRIEPYQSFRQGLCVWLEYKAPTADFQPYYGKQDKEVYHP